MQIYRDLDMCVFWLGDAQGLPLSRAHTGESCVQQHNNAGAVGHSKLLMWIKSLNYWHYY